MRLIKATVVFAGIVGASLAFGSASATPLSSGSQAASQADQQSLVIAVQHGHHGGGMGMRRGGGGMGMRHGGGGGWGRRGGGYGGYRRGYGGYGYGYGYSYPRRCWTRWDYGYPVRVCRP